MNKEFLQGGDFDKFIVLHSEDLRNYFSDSGIYNMKNKLEYIENMRESEGKSINNQYLVVNINESYAPEIVEILKRNGHWG